MHEEKGKYQPCGMLQRPTDAERLGQMGVTLRGSQVPTEYLHRKGRREKMKGGEDNGGRKQRKEEVEGAGREGRDGRGRDGN